MNCEQVQAILPGYWESSDDEQAAVQAHLERCSACRAGWNEFEVLQRDLANRLEFGPEVYASLAYGVRRRIRRSHAVPWMWAAAAALVVSAGLGLRPAAVERLNLTVRQPAVPAILAGFRKPVPATKVKQSRTAPSPAMEIRILGDDPSVLIVWQVGGLPSGGGDE